jgi:hypothetical protein
MNNTNSSTGAASGVNIQAQLDLLYALTFFRTDGSYILTTICSVGVILNLICLLVFFNQDMKDKTYFYFRAKTISELVVTL